MPAGPTGKMPVLQSPGKAPAWQAKSFVQSVVLQRKSKFFA